MIDIALYDKLTHYCSYSERCEHDVRLKCSKLNIETEKAAYYIAKLKEEGFVNDARYASSFVRSKSKRGWGSLKIKNALSRKKIPKEFIQKSLEEIDVNLQKEKVLDLAQKKLKNIKAKTDSERKTKLIRFLIGKGYSFDLANAISKQVSDKI